MAEQLVGMFACLQMSYIVFSCEDSCIRLATSGDIQLYAYLYEMVAAYNLVYSFGF